ncbi:hypothetical protein D778_00748 [Xanthomarina gelatinilytica]|uniref:Prenyltransferase n=1 Tax=Xanthomarina gelatinilytica TaxID=1137281 RepID=M7MHZ7_9FLAO|nr:hypothetical protein [Xanthomarina gelatinilytica]EMQ94465.1 hypothetical protein D778_00748 [Xanthomarina gelatinilytica]
MALLKQIFNFYIDSSIHVALAVFALSWVTLLEFGIPYDRAVLYFIFFASITGYNFVKYFGLARFHHRSLTNWLKLIQVFSLMCFIGMCYFALKLELISLVVILGFGVVTFLYAIPFLPNKILYDKHKNLRNVSGLKVYIIALVWAGVTVVLPLLNNHVPLDTNVVVTGFQRFVFVTVLMFPFEIRDLNYDSLKLATIPQQIGIKNTKMVGVLLLMLFFLLEFLKPQLNVEHTVSMLITMFVTLMFLIFANRNQGRYYSSFWVEGIPLVWLLLLLVF